MYKTKNKLGIIALLLILTISISACTKKEVGVIAKVNGENILLDNFNKEYEMLKNARVEQYGEEILEKDVEGQPYEEFLKEGLFNMLVNEIIISKDLENLEIGITDEEVNEEISNFKNEYIAQLEEGANGEEEYNNFLEEQGITEEYLKTTLRREMLLNKHREDFLNKTHLEDQDISKYYEEYKGQLEKIRISHILVENEEEGKKVLAKLNEGVEFSALAATESLDSQTAVQGGDFGTYLRKGDFSKMGLEELEEPAFALEVGKHSDLIETSLGLHILYLEEKLVNLEDLKTDVIQELKYQKYIEKIASLQEAAEVKILDKNFKF